MSQNLPKCKYRNNGGCILQCTHKYHIDEKGDVVTPRYPVKVTDGQCIYRDEDVNLCPQYETKGVRVEHYIHYLKENTKGGIWLTDKVFVSNNTILKWLEESGGMSLCR